MCGLVVTVEGETVTKVRGDEDHPLSRGYSCSKGRSLGALHHDSRRLNQPLVGREPLRQPTDWKYALDDIADQVASQISEQGADSIAMYLASGSAFDAAGRRAAERFLSVLGSRQKYTATTIDTPSKPLIAELVGGWSGLTPLWDHESSKLLLLFGSNPVVSHGHSNALPDPVRRFREFKSRGGELWVVDPRRTETASLADHHMQLRPGTDWLVLGWLVRRLLHNHPSAQTIYDRTTGASDLIAAVRGFTDELVSVAADVAMASLEELLAAIVRSGQVSALTGTGVSMSASANISEYLLWALHIVTDSYDQPGGMWFNPGYLSQLDKREFIPVDGSPEPGPKSRPSLPRRFGEYPCAALVSEIEAGNVTTLIVVGGNPVTALPDTERTRRALASLTTLVVIDILPTDTTHLATHVLPAVDQLERADTTWLLDTFQLAVAAQFTEAVVSPRDQRQPMWWMFAQLAERLGLATLPGSLTLADATDSLLLESVIARSRNPNALKIAPTSTIYSGAVFGWVRSQVLPGGKWRLTAPPIFDQLQTQLSLTNGVPPPALVLIPNRRPRLMNSQFQSMTPPGLPEETPAIQVSVAAAETLGMPTTAVLTSAFGKVTADLHVDESLRDDCVVLSHGWGEANVCQLTSADHSIDALSGMVLQSGIEVVLTPPT